MPPDEPESPKIGLREKKKRKTRMTLQQQALRLFREQGYHATTIEQIAEASEISPSTFFRYFSTKEALVLEDEYDPVLIRAFQGQPPDLNPIQALRAAVSSGFAMFSQEEKDALRERTDLMLSVPELRAASLIQMNDSLLLIAEIVADRLERPRDDFEVLTFAGAVLGVMMSVQLYCSSNPEADFVATIDEALAQLEAGFPFVRHGSVL
ncbi:TetR family transcriptional regulator [Cohnella silvisoli]|uniref:TetR family transcriptional regulator n=1 Tax=Cohnella silvisoli TaxID=2873699 RepID=A0ABV1KS09_9BACL|nr:TetR family transcriptional regulator [Cohnella silvisoli]MCD9022590.1 TetR family transcriptional regulator [Cohnella silvisoli]